MKQMPKPLAVFAANDEQALDDRPRDPAKPLASACPTRSPLSALKIISWPPTPCTRRFPAWTPICKCSVIKARPSLDRLMSGKPAPDLPVRVPAVTGRHRAQEQLTSSPSNIPASPRALRFIWEHCHEPIGVEGPRARRRQCPAADCIRHFLSTLAAHPAANFNAPASSTPKNSSPKPPPKRWIQSRKCAATKARIAFGSPSNKPPAHPPKQFREAAMRPPASTVNLASPPETAPGKIADESLSPHTAIIPRRRGNLPAWAARNFFSRGGKLRSSAICIQLWSHLCRLEQIAVSRVHARW